MATFGHTDADSMRGLAGELTNGKRGDLHAISEGMAWLLRYIADITESGYVTPDECQALHAQVTTAVRGQVEKAVRAATPTRTSSQWYAIGQMAVKAGSVPSVCATVCWLGWIVAKAKGWI